MRVWQSDQWCLEIGDGTPVLYFSTQGEAQMAQSQADYIAAVKSANKAVWDGINNLVELQRQWNALAYGDTLVDPTGALTAAEIGAVVFDTADLFVGVLNAGSATNMAKLL